MGPSPKSSGYNGKRFLDLALVIGSAPAWVPVIVALAAAVRFLIGSPVLFAQERAGLGGRAFRIVKFRSMTDARLADGSLAPDDERLTGFGRWLRGTSLDELPELLNVLRGDMSLVGPRPLHVRYLPRYSAYHARRHELRPGLTGLAQVSGRNALSWPARLDLDVHYVDSCSFALDLRILAMTFLAVLQRRGVSAPGEATMHEFLGYQEDQAC